VWAGFFTQFTELSSMIPDGARIPQWPIGKGCAHSSIGLMTRPVSARHGSRTHIQQFGKLRLCPLS
jgi:hypothetical protein